jgi:hypothetical protein
MLKRIGGWILLILAVVTFLLVVAGIAGTWLGRNAIDQGADALLVTAEDYLGLAITGLESVDASLAAAQTNVDNITASAEEIAASGNSPTAVALQATVADDIAPLIVNTEEVVGGVYKAMQGFNTTLVTLNRTPGINVPTFTPQLDAVGARLQAVSNGLETLGQRIAESDGAGIIAATTQISNDIAVTRNQLDESKQMVANTQAGMEIVRVNLPWYTRVGAIASTILLVLLAWGQWLLVGLASGWALARR